MALRITANAKIFGGQAKGLVGAKTITIHCENDIKITLPTSFLPTVEVGEGVLVSLSLVSVTDKPADVEALASLDLSKPQ